MSAPPGRTPPNAGPHFVGPETPCVYCGRAIRMYGSRFSNVDDGEFHTCVHAGKRVGPSLVDGDFAYFDYGTLAPNGESHER